MISLIFQLITFLNCTPVINLQAANVNEDYRIFNEGSYCLPITVDTTMHWYGIYRTKNVDSLVEVELQPIKHWNEGHMTWSTIATDRSETSQALFIIGSKKPLENKVVSRYEMHKTQILYPSIAYGVYGVDENGNQTTRKVLTATGNVKNVVHCPFIENYKLMISDYPSYENAQDLNEYFNIPSECGMYHIAWFGDLDSDSKPDLILQSSSNTLETILLLSSEAKGVKHVEKVAAIISGSCC